MKLIIASVVALLSFAGLAQADVVTLTPDNFDDVVNGDTNVLVEFYAPWCGHCKNLAPEYERVGKHYKASDGVVIAKVDADAERDLGSKFGVQGFPTLKWFPKGSTDAEEFGGGRTAESIVEWINDKTGIKRRLKAEPSDVATLTDLNFAKIALDETKDVFVEFYAPWCGHCKALGPKWEKLGTVFSGEDNVVIAKVDADKYRDLGSKYDVSGFPTLKWFPKGSDKTPLPYEGARELEDLVKFTNEKAGTFRTTDGGLTAEAARVKELDAIVVGNKVDSALISKLKDAVAKLSGQKKDDGKLYVKIAQKIAEKGNDYVDSEIARLENMVSSPSVSAKKKTLFYRRKNILAAFQQE